MKSNLCIVLLLSLITGCTCSSSPSAKSPSAIQEPDSLALRTAKQELTSPGQSLHDRLDYRIVEKDCCWIVTVSNLSGRQPKGQAYFPGDAVMVLISKEGKTLEYKGVR